MNDYKAIDAIALLLRHYASGLVFPSDTQYLADLVEVLAQNYEKDTTIKDTSKRPLAIAQLLSVADMLRSIEITM